MAAKYTPVQIDANFKQMIELIEKGYSVRKACKELHISTRTFNEWLQVDVEKQNQYVRATQVRADNIFEEILDIADEANKDVLRVDEYGNQIINNEFVQRSRIRIDARKWMLGKMNPKKYGDSVKLTGDADNPIQSKLTIEILPATGRIASSEGEIEAD